MENDEDDGIIDDSVTFDEEQLLLYVQIPNLESKERFAIIDMLVSVSCARVVRVIDRALNIESVYTIILN